MTTGSEKWKRTHSPSPGPDAPSFQAVAILESNMFSGPKVLPVCGERAEEASAAKGARRPSLLLVSADAVVSFPVPSSDAISSMLSPSVLRGASVPAGLSVAGARVSWRFSCERVAVSLSALFGFLVNPPPHRASIGRHSEFSRFCRFSFLLGVPMHGFSCPRPGRLGRARRCPRQRLNGALVESVGTGAGRVWEFFGTQIGT